MASKYAKGLHAAFTALESNQGYLKNLEKLKAEGSVPNDQYDSMKEEYGRKIPPAESEIKAIKNRVERELDALKKEQGVVKKDLDNLSTRNKVGEIPLEKFRSMDAKLRRRNEQIETEMAEFENLLKANCAADIWQGPPGKSSGYSAPRL
ncbi:MAG: CdvA-like protein [Dehalococcoidia bacterium]